MFLLTRLLTKTKKKKKPCPSSAQPLSFPSCWHKLAKLVPVKWLHDPSLSWKVAQTGVFASSVDLGCKIFALFCELGRLCLCKTPRCFFLPMHKTCNTKLIASCSVFTKWSMRGCPMGYQKDEMRGEKKRRKYLKFIKY